MVTGPLSAGVSAAVAEPGSVQHELGGGIQGRVNGHSIALGNLEWISKHAELPGSSRAVQPEAGASPTHSQTEVSLRQPSRPVHVARQMRGGCLGGIPQLLSEIWEWHPHPPHKRRVKLEFVLRCSLREMERWWEAWCCLTGSGEMQQTQSASCRTEGIAPSCSQVSIYRHGALEGQAHALLGSLTVGHAMQVSPPCGSTMHTPLPLVKAWHIRA